MSRSAGHQRIYAKRPTQPDEENLIKRKKQAANPDSSPVSGISTLATTTVQRAKTSPQSLTAHEIRQLQATIGNHALSRMIAPQTTGVSTAPVIQRSPITVNQSAASKDLVQRWKWPWRRNETPKQKYDRYTKTIENIETAKNVLRVGHGLVMLPLTVVDVISNIARPFTENPVKVPGGEKKEQNLKVFHNVLNGESQLVALMAGGNKYLDLKILKYMPWNILPGIIGALNRWSRKVNKKRTALNL